MKHTLNLLFLIITFSSISASASAKEPNQWCTWNGDQVALNGSVFVVDQAILKEANKKGKSVSRDWSGYLMSCRMTYKINPNPDSSVLGDVLSENGPAMTIGDNHRDYFAHLKNPNNNP